MHKESEREVQSFQSFFQGSSQSGTFESTGLPFPLRPAESVKIENQNLLKVLSPKEIKLVLTRTRAFSALAPIWWNAPINEIRAL